VVLGLAGSVWSQCTNMAPITVICPDTFPTCPQTGDCSSYQGGIPLMNNWDCASTTDESDCVTGFGTVNLKTCYIVYPCHQIGGEGPCQPTGQPPGQEYVKAIKIARDCPE
jgi:hypothetical protein